MSATCVWTASASAQSAASGGGTDTPPRIVASFSILGDLVREVAMPEALVTTLVGPDADAHVFEPTPADVRRLAQADLLVVNGLGFEGWMDRLVQAAGYAGPVVVATRGIKPRSFEDEHGDGMGNDHDDDHDHGGPDPHAWQDLRNARRYVHNIAEALAARWPAQAADMRQRATDMTARIDALDARVRSDLAAIPRAQRRVITSHDAFGYFAASYGVDMLAPQGWTTASEPSAAAVARLIRQIRNQHARALFIENMSDPRLIEQISRETGVRIGGTLYADALSAPGGPADTYLKLFDHNARLLTAALHG